MPQAFYVGVVLIPAWIFLLFGRRRITRLPWISIPLAVALLCALILELAWPHPPANGDYTWMRIVGGFGTAMWLLGVGMAWRLQSNAKYLTKAIEFRLAKLEADGHLSDAAVLDQRQQLEELARLIAPIGVVPGSDITTAWVEARLREMAAIPVETLQPLEIADSKRLPEDR